MIKATCKKWSRDTQQENVHETTVILKLSVSLDDGVTLAYLAVCRGLPGNETRGGNALVKTKAGSARYLLVNILLLLLSSPTVRRRYRVLIVRDESIGTSMNTMRCALCIA